MIRPVQPSVSARNSTRLREVLTLLSVIVGLCGIIVVIQKDRTKFLGLLATPNSTDPEVRWGYSNELGPDNWWNLSTSYRKCKFGALQAPVDVTTGAIKARLFTIPVLRWNGFENWTSIGQAPYVRSSFGKYGYSTKFVERAPTITIPEFTQYLNLLPLARVEKRTYSLRRVLFKTPSENLIDGKR